MNIEATHLGKKSEYPQQYNPNVLVAVPRKFNRTQYNLHDDQLPFVGKDVWHAYEFSFLLENGFPIAGMLKIVYDSSSFALVESKSLKLYLNSFNMSKFGNNKAEGIILTSQLIESDLSKLLATNVSVTFLEHDACAIENDFINYPILESTIAIEDFNCSEYSENPELLEVEDGNEFKFGTHLLRSNCKITFQPDWGSLFISMAGNQIPSKESFLKYIVSLRNENHFHEEICEMVFKRILDKFNPNSLTVTCNYTRRGGIDINPTRSTHQDDLPKHLIDSTQLTNSVFRQ